MRRRVAAVLSVLAVLFTSTLLAQESRDAVPLRDWAVPFEEIRAKVMETEPRLIAERSLHPSVNAVPSAASHFITVVPCRVVDTRNPNGPYGGPKLVGGTSRSFVIPSGPCAGIPVAAAYSLNLTVNLPETDNGFLKAYPSGSAQPLVASLNFNTNETKGNAAIVPADGTGSIDIFSNVTTHLIIDINGYFKEGVVTNLTAGNGMTGGGTGSVTLGIANSGVGTTQLATSAVTSSTIANGAVGTVQIANGAVGTAQIASGAVGTAQIADGGATDAKVGTLTSAGKVANSATTATSANVANTIVARDGTGGFGAGALTLGGKIVQTSIDGLVASGTFFSGVIPATGAGIRLMWYPGKAAFRAGSVSGTQWDDASVGSYSTAMGGNTTASGDYSTAMGGFTSASGQLSTAIGYVATASGAASTAMGYYASTTGGGIAHAGAFVYGDNSTTTLVTPSADNQFVVRAAGGTTFYSNAAMNLGVSLAANGNAWASVSDRNRKEDFRDINGEEILNKLAALPVMSWRYKNDDSGNRYIGPMAQDFHALFGLGTDTTIATLDMEGVTLAAVKALQRENATLRDQLEWLMRRVEQLEAKATAAR
jgi:hypothetical protein